MRTKAPVAGPDIVSAGRIRVVAYKPPVTVRRGRPVVVAIVVVLLALVAGILLWHSIRINDGHFVFSLDDPYIHLSMARSLAVDGVWGAQPAGFSATSSAPLYTLLLALVFLIGGPSVAWGWGFAMAGGLAAAGVLAYAISRHFDQTVTTVVLGLFAVVISGIPEMMFSGMEHTLHMTVVGLIALVAAAQSGKTDAGLRASLILPALVLVGCGLRYETMFIIPALFGFLWWKGRRRDAVLVGVASILPAIVLGVVQLAHGQMILPNTLMLKGVVGDGEGLGYLSRLIRQIGSSYFVGLVALVGLGVFIDIFYRTDTAKTSRLLPGAMFLSACVFQAAFAKVDRRYVGYLLVLGIIAATPYASAWFARALSAMHSGGEGRARLMVGGALIVCVGVLPFAGRIVDLGRLPQLTHDVYAQQYQVARFFAEEYPGKRVGLNDIGTTCWFGENPVLDLWGIADGGVARARVRGQWKPDKMRAYATATGTEVVAVYPNWYSGMGGLPRDWLPVGSWDLAGVRQINVAQPQVVFFATSQAAAQLLKSHLREFAPKLPAGVVFNPFM